MEIRGRSNFRIEKDLRLMPKIIENVREKVLSEAKNQVLKMGYSSMTIRSVAGACKIATGTVYNYFPSKEMMVASFMIEDWMKTLEKIKSGCSEDKTVEDVLRTVHGEICSFAMEYEGLFKDPEAKTGFSKVYLGRHETLVKQIASLLEPVCQAKAKEYSPLLSEFIAGSLLSSVMAEKDLAELIKIIKQLFN